MSPTKNTCVLIYFILLFCYSDAFYQRKMNADDGGPENGPSSPAAEGEEDRNAAAGSPAICTTRAQRLSFLKGLSTHDNYKAAFRMLKGSLSFDDIDGLPVWASWSSGSAELPASFFDRRGLELAVASIATVASSIDAMEPVIVLACGLVLRGISTAREINGRSDVPADAPERLRMNAINDGAEARLLQIIESAV